MEKGAALDKERLGVGSFRVPKNAKKYILDVLASKRISYGPYLKKFESEFAKQHDARFAVAVSSGTSALRIALGCLKEAGKWNDGDEVIIPAVTFVSDINIILQNNLVPVLVDVDPITYNIDASAIEAKVTPKSRAIIPSHLFGQPADMAPIMQLAKKHKLKVVEDSCETMFATYRGKKVGSIGDIGCFSTYVAHILVTGVGGLITTNNPTYAKILRSLANHGRDGIYISLEDSRGKRDKALHEVVSRRFRFVRSGYSSRLTEFEGALGCAQLEEVPLFLPKRKQHADFLRAQLSQYEKYIQLPAAMTDRDHVFMMFPVVLKQGSKIKKKQLINFLEDRGIETREMLPLINQPMMQSVMDIDKKDFPVADWINSNGFYIGCHPDMRKKELSYIVDSFKEFFDFRKP